MKRKRITCHMLGVCLPIYVEAARVVVHVHMSLQRHGTLVSVGVCVCRGVLHVFVVRSCTLAPTKNPFPLPLLPLGTRPTAICIRLMPVLIVLCFRVMAVLPTQ